MRNIGTTTLNFVRPLLNYVSLSRIVLSSRTVSAGPDHSVHGDWQAGSGYPVFTSPLKYRDRVVA
ncbi:hypothetical protein GCM10011492_40310 [Flexivirga endophytica]|uniref:Uncharacterized protein n=1 Tax=Flexivirga endophytica TaxID=1849103 RepID=A0A916X0Z6_9MICO|nr:hypothetical protein GCM10011492_40310 [Flexivirga endophytica]GHB66806.1 hypothetical protein GCM10008112_39680 [Flexivirga endophytica]